MGLLSGIWKVIKWPFGLILPVFAKATDFSKTGATWLWILRFVILVAILAGLWAINWWFDLERIVRAPFPVLRAIWLPLVFLLLYWLVWLAWWLKKLWDEEEDAPLFPEMDAAWNEAMVALSDAGIDLTRTPLFLLLGKTASREDALFEAGQIELKVNRLQQRPNAPIQVYANQDGVYVSCAPSSLSGRQCELLHSSGASERPSTAGAARHSSAAAGPFADMPSTVSQSLGAASQSGSSQAATLVAEQERPSQTHDRKLHQNLLAMEDETERLTVRLRHLCRLIARERAPYCPLNGILLVIPFTATRSNEDSRHTGAVMHHDLQIVHEECRVRCPIIPLFADFELDHGFREFLSRIPSELAHQRFGQLFPLAPDLPADQVARTIEKAVEWICQTLVRSAVYKVLDRAGRGASSSDLARRNARLFHFLNELDARRQRLGRLLVRAAVSEMPSPPLLGGCFLAATADVPEGQAFVTGVLQLLLENQNYVSWTREATDDERSYLRRARLGYIAVAIAAVLTIAFTYAIWP